MTERIEIIFSVPEKIRVGEPFIISYRVVNPLDEEVSVYLGFYTSLNEVILPPQEIIVDAYGESEGAATLSINREPYTIIAKADAYIGNSLIATGKAEIQFEAPRRAPGTLLLAGLGSILWGATHG